MESNLGRNEHPESVSHSCFLWVSFSGLFDAKIDEIQVRSSLLYRLLHCRKSLLCAAHVRNLRKVPLTIVPTKNSLFNCILQCFLTIRRPRVSSVSSAYPSWFVPPPLSNVLEKWIQVTVFTRGYRLVRNMLWELRKTCQIVPGTFFFSSKTC